VTMLHFAFSLFLFGFWLQICTFPRHFTMDAAKLEFATVTGCRDPAKALFYLESSGGDVAAAVEAFFEHGDGGGDDNEARSEDPGSAHQTAPVAAAVSSKDTAAGGARAAPSARRNAATGNVRGFGDLNGAADDENDDEKPTEWYTGGAASGSVVQDPTSVNKKKEKNKDRLQSVLDGARASGAVDGRAEDLDARSNPSGSGGNNAFAGSGRTLGSTPGGEESDVDPAPPTERPPAPTQTQPQGPTVHTITFWADGFTVNDGGLRHYDDPANTPFMEAVSKGTCPAELAPDDPTTAININLVRKEMNYEPPVEPKYKAFSGSGRTLSSVPADDSSGAPSPAQQQTVPTSTNDVVGLWSCDETQPSASVQLRLRDGSRKVAKVRAFPTEHVPPFAIAHTRPDEGTIYYLCPDRLLILWSTVYPSQSLIPITTD
jgi:UBX domain-containing protein 1